MADTQEDIDNHQSYIQGFNDSRNQRPDDSSSSPSPDFYKLGYEDGGKDE